jgi:hypothetical protein
MVKKLVTVYYARCKTEACNKRVTFPRTLATNEVKSMTCREGHVNDYSEADVQQATSEAKIGR